MRKKYLSVQETAEALGISRQTLLRYEKLGVFPKPKRNPVNKWREYTEADLGELKTVLGRNEK